MTAIARFEFPAGRYHATPWGRHVNEGAVEWPPSPWRLLRALIAVGFNRLGWAQIDETARALLDSLSAVAPSYALPAAGAAHSRHYMPLFKEKTTRIIDTFAVIDRVDAPLFVEWLVDLPEPQRRLLDDLLRALPYLGRAESWVDAQLVDSAPGARWLRPGAPSEQGERVDALSPVAPNDYRAWREGAVAELAEAELSRMVETAKAKGKKPPVALTPDQRAKLEALVPVDLVAAMRSETADLQAGGWSAPPGSRWVSYWRPRDALERPPVVRRQRFRPGEPIRALLFAVRSETKEGLQLPPLRDALRRADLIHRTLASFADQRSLSPEDVAQLTGHPMTNHRHLSLCPVSLGGIARGEHPGRRRIDHVLAWVGGERLSSGALAVLRSVRKTYASRMPSLWLTPVWEGLPEKRQDLPWFAASRVWESHTPFVAPRHLKKNGKSSLAGQLATELEQRGWPLPTRIELAALVNGTETWLPVDENWPLMRGPTASRRLSLAWRAFRRERREGIHHVVTQPAFGLRLTFAQLVAGPISVGYGSHFGLGFFEAVAPAAEVGDANRGR